MDFAFDFAPVSKLRNSSQIIEYEPDRQLFQSAAVTHSIARRPRHYESHRHPREKEKERGGSRGQGIDK